MKTVRLVQYHWTFVILMDVLMVIFSDLKNKSVSPVLLDVKDAKLLIFQNVSDVTVVITHQLSMEKTLVSDVTIIVMNVQAPQLASNVLKDTLPHQMDQSAKLSVATIVLLATLQTLIFV
jgi:hypothetical protein